MTDLERSELLKAAKLLNIACEQMAQISATLIRAATAEDDPPPLPLFDPTEIIGEFTEVR